MRVPAFDDRVEFGEQILPFLRLFPVREIFDGTVANNIHPFFELSARLKKLRGEITGTVRLSDDRPPPPFEVSGHLFRSDSMRKDHRGGRFGAVVAGEQQHPRWFEELLFYSCH